ncbi:hypothetical protein HHI36_002977 [Cryptolaemus montrouzieri]|uniref:E3 ubiquitin-protein ligase n=1 Tax=Cryptolaemus montrouzieri TaxID=559131 RepID=A0ABD2PCV7_9CUCU
MPLRNMGQEELDLLEQLECPICTDYFTIPIKQCTSGHSICGKCTERLGQCSICQAPFTEIRNFSVEALSLKMIYPCINKNAGCTALLSYTEREQHELQCCSQGLQTSCQMKGCSFTVTGDPAAVKSHWQAKKNSCKIYGPFNKCTLKIKSESYFVNLVEAFNQLFWYKSRISNNFINFAMQYIGKPEDAHKFFYQIEIRHEAFDKKKIVISDYCKSMIPDEELFKEDICISIYLPSVKQLLSSDVMNGLNYILRVKKVSSDLKRKRNYHNPRSTNGRRPHIRDLNRESTNEFVAWNGMEERLFTEEEQRNECCVIL